MLEDVLAWPDWWRGVERAEQIRAGDAQKVGSRYLVEWRSRIPYPVAFEFEVDRVERPFVMEGRAEGELSGRGRWRLFEQDGLTAVTYDWKVRTTKAWMNLRGSARGSGVQLEPRHGDDLGRRGARPAARRAPYRSRALIASTSVRSLATSTCPGMSSLSISRLSL